MPDVENKLLSDVTDRLASFGYTVTEGDALVLGFIIDKTENHIKNSCNLTSVPEGLYQVEVDMVCGNFLFEKKRVDSDSLTGFDLDAAAKQIHEGDTSITFALGEGSTTPEQRLDSLIAYLQSYGEPELTRYRCMAW